MLQFCILLIYHNVFILLFYADNGPPLISGQAGATTWGSSARCHQRLVCLKPYLHHVVCWKEKIKTYWEKMYWVKKFMWVNQLMCRMRSLETGVCYSNGSQRQGHRSSLWGPHPGLCSVLQLFTLNECWQELYSVSSIIVIWNWKMLVGFMFAGKVPQGALWIWRTLDLQPSDLW